MPQPRRLLDEERIPAGAAVDLGDQRVVGLRARRPGHERADLVRFEAGESDRSGLREQRQHERAKRVIGRFDLDIPVCADQQQPFEPGVLGGELQQPQRRGIGPVQIVEHHDDRLVLGSGHQHARHRVVQAEPVRRAVAARLAEQDVQRAVGHRGPAALADRAPQPADHLCPRPVARSARRVPAGPVEHEGADTLRLFGGAGDERGLADSGFPGDQHQPAVAFGGAGDLRAEHPRGMVTSDERG